MSSLPEIRHNLKRISPYTVELGEGPHYDEKTGRLYHVDLVKGGCYYLDTKTLEYESIYFEPGLTLIVPIEGKAGQFVISKNRSLYTLDWAKKSCDLITTVDHDKDTRVNDGKCDPSGRLWFGTMNWERKPGCFAPNLGSLYSLNHNRQVSLHQDNVTIANGLAWSSCKTKFYFIDSMARQVWVYDYDDQSGNISKYIISTITKYYLNQTKNTSPKVNLN
ncbi:regucalcin-like [Tetranychus urticae]|uniref:SMP-30/Gluconolactonase/LRE-like region domain-containing protein n=1 Tax=Tetranychus urticae TaxID=32264 RepID=T1KEL1_TETUR|nr:regucalcin-like [Tetranychus urticae]